MYEKSSGIRHFQVLAYPKEPELAHSGAAELAWEGQAEEDGFNGGRWV